VVLEQVKSPYIVVLASCIKNLSSVVKLKKKKKSLEPRWNRTYYDVSDVMIGQNRRPKYCRIWNGEIGMERS
jgi:hypothetical protein